MIDYTLFIDISVLWKFWMCCGNKCRWVLVLPWWSADLWLFWMSGALQMSQKAISEPPEALGASVNGCAQMSLFLERLLDLKLKEVKISILTSPSFPPSFLPNVSLGVSRSVLLGLDVLGLDCRCQEQSLGCGKGRDFIRAQSWAVTCLCWWPGLLPAQGCELQCLPCRDRDKLERWNYLAADPCGYRSWASDPGGCCSLLTWVRSVPFRRWLKCFSIWDGNMGMSWPIPIHLLVILHVIRLVRL